MFKHLLVPTDGSDLSKQAMHKAVGMDKEMGAKVTGFHVVPESRYAYYNEYIPADFIPPEEQEARSKKVATGYLGTRLRVSHSSAPTVLHGQALPVVLDALVSLVPPLVTLKAFLWCQSRHAQVKTGPSRNTPGVCLLNFFPSLRHQNLIAPRRRDSALGSCSFSEPVLYPFTLNNRRGFKFLATL